MRDAPKSSKRWRCAECGDVYTSPIAVLEVQHKCKKPPVPNQRRKGMLPE